MSQNNPKAKRVTDDSEPQRKTSQKIKRPQFTSNFTHDNKLFYLYLDLIRK